MEKAPSMVETYKLVEPLTEAKVSKMGVLPKVADPCILAKTTDGAKVEMDRGSRSLLQLPRTAAKSVSTLMVSAFQSGWQMCSWKVSTIFPLPPTTFPPLPTGLPPPSIHLFNIDFLHPYLVPVAEIGS